MLAPTLIALFTYCSSSQEENTGIEHGLEANIFAVAVARARDRWSRGRLTKQASKQIIIIINQSRKFQQEKEQLCVMVP